MSNRKPYDGKRRQLTNRSAHPPSHPGSEYTDEIGSQFLKLSLDQNALDSLKHSMTLDFAKNSAEGPYLAVSQTTNDNTKHSVNSNLGNPFGSPPTRVAANTGKTDGPYLTIGTGQNIDLSQHSVKSHHSNPFGTPPTRVTANAGQPDGPYLVIASGQQTTDPVRSNQINPFGRPPTGAGKKKGPYLAVSSGQNILNPPNINETPSDGAALENAAEPNDQKGCVGNKSSVELNSDVSDQPLNIPVLNYDRESMIYVKNLGYAMGQEALRAAFSSFGRIICCEIARNSKGYSRGFGFVQFDCQESARKAISQGSKMAITKRPIRVHRFLPPREREVHSGPLTSFMNLYVRNFDEEYDDMRLQLLFEPYGNVVSCKIIRDDKGASRNFAFVRFDTSQSAFSAIVGLHGKEVGPYRSMYVCPAHDRKGFCRRRNSRKMEQQNAHPQRNGKQNGNGQPENNGKQEQDASPNTMGQNEPTE